MSHLVLFCQSVYSVLLGVCGHNIPVVSQQIIFKRAELQFCRHFNFFNFVVAAASLYFKKANSRFPIARERGIEITLRRHDQCALQSTSFLEFSEVLEVKESK